MTRRHRLSRSRVAASAAPPLAIAVGLILLLAPSASAQSAAGFYISTDFGLTSAFGADATAFGANRPTRCDRLLYANSTSAPTAAACTAPLTSSRQGSFFFDRNSGTAQAIALGYAVGNLRFEAELLLRGQTGRAATFEADGDVALIGKDTEWSELSAPNADIYNFRSREIFANAYHVFEVSSDWTPYVGAGAGLAMLDFGFYMEFLRKSLADGYLESFGGSGSRPEAAPEWQLAAAGTMSLMDEPVREATVGYRLLAGVDRALSERTALGLKIRWTSFGTASVNLPFKLIRSHKPVHADGRTPFAWDFDFTRLGYLGASLEMKYRL